MRLKEGQGSKERAGAAEDQGNTCKSYKYDTVGFYTIYHLSPRIRIDTSPLDPRDTLAPFQSSDEEFSVESISFDHLAGIKVFNVITGR